MKLSFQALVLLTSTLSISVIAETSQPLKVPVVVASDGGYGNGNNCFINVEIMNNAETSALGYEVELRLPTGEWIVLSDGNSALASRFRFEMAGELASAELAIRARSRGNYVNNYFGTNQAKFSEFSPPVRALCQSD